MTFTRELWFLSSFLNDILRRLVFTIFSYFVLVFNSTCIPIPGSESPLLERCILSMVVTQLIGIWVRVVDHDNC